MNKKIIDPDGFIICRKCFKELPRTNEFFSKNCANKKYGLMIICKICDNKRRSEKEKLRAYHNQPKRCITCNGFFYQSLSNINKAKKRNYIRGAKACSKVCSTSVGMTGKSWKGSRRGENNPNSVLNDNTVRLIKSDIAKGIKNREIAKLYNINAKHISRIRTNRCWTHIAIDLVANK